MSAAVSRAWLVETEAAVTEDPDDESVPLGRQRALSKQIDLLPVQYVADWSRRALRGSCGFALDAFAFPARPGAATTGPASGRYGPSGLRSAFRLSCGARASCW